VEILIDGEPSPGEMVSDDFFVPLLLLFERPDFSGLIFRMADSTAPSSRISLIS